LDCIHGGDETVYRILVGSLKGRDHPKDLGIDERIILKWISRKSGGSEGTGCIWLRIGTGGGL
jgi:hypothetical protein